MTENPRLYVIDYLTLYVETIRATVLQEDNVSIVHVPSADVVSRVDRFGRVHLQMVQLIKILGLVDGEIHRTIAWETCTSTIMITTAVAL